MCVFYSGLKSANPASGYRGKGRPIFAGARNGSISGVTKSVSKTYICIVGLENSDTSNMVAVAYSFQLVKFIRQCVPKRIFEKKEFFAECSLPRLVGKGEMKLSKTSLLFDSNRCLFELNRNFSYLLFVNNLFVPGALLTNLFNAFLILPKIKSTCIQCECVKGRWRGSVLRQLNCVLWCYFGNIYSINNLVLIIYFVYTATAHVI